MTEIQIVYKQLYYNTEWLINVVLDTNNMFSLSKVTIYIVEAFLKYLDFMISCSIPFTIMHKLLDVNVLDILDAVDELRNKCKMPRCVTDAIGMARWMTFTLSVVSALNYKEQIQD